ncbi:prepilin-type N-terminal cleavage/methylation domain-containing protein [Vibrio alginolyticus]|uniref:PilW family protein n=1 Tax=Vibrio alginolyticus TaxID=663 RepID=UPI0037547EBE
MKIRGFTLMEMIITVVIGSVIMLGIAGYVRLGFKGYSDTIDRQRLQTQAQFVIEKMSREIRHAVPNSFEVTQGGRCLSFFPTLLAGFYSRQGVDNIGFIVGNVKADGSSYDRVPDGLRMIINPSYSDDFYNSTSDMDVGGEEKSSSTGAFAINKASAFSSDSVGSRFYLFHPNLGVRYCWNEQNKVIERGNISVSSHDDMVDVETISANVSSTAFEFQLRALQSGGIVHMDFVFEQDGERSAYQQDVQVLNVP